MSHPPCRNPGSQATRASCLAASLALVFVLSGCATNYGYGRPMAALIEVSAPPGISRFYITRVASYDAVFPDSPSFLPRTDQRLDKFLNDSIALPPSTPAFPLDEGKYVFASACRDGISFQLFWVSQSTHQVRLQCLAS